MALWVTEAEPTELRAGATEEDVQEVIRAAYKQVLGNIHVLDNQRLVSAEAMVRSGEISVRGFVSMIAKSDWYKSLFFESASQYRFIELNCKHFLGRAPLDQAEISQHVKIYNELGYDAEIDSYIDSDEYQAAYGENTVPYPRSTSSQTGFKNSSYVRGFTLLRGDATSDRSGKAKLISVTAGNGAGTVTAPAAGSGAADNTGKRYRIAIAKAGVTPIYKQSNLVYEVSYAQMSQKIQNIHKTGGKILSITEVA
ncbi:MAG: phycobilisome rod-core linker polypeptide [Prochloron sp. SP5CPC1]|nr:phycobilisome rod-core linker polypeptide [Candidatus Paraprochloron terpiosi SP5CPC1]